MVLAPPETRHSPPRLAALLRSAAITFVLLPPAVLSLLDDEPFPALRVLLTGGEELPAELARRWAARDLSFVNAYGPTEATVIATYQVLDAKPPADAAAHRPGQPAQLPGVRARPAAQSGA